MFWRQYAFSIGPVDFLQIDVALAAMVFGEWARFERRLTEGLACLARATEEHRLPSRGSLDDAVTAFRYARDLIAGSDVTAWLERTGVSSDAWMAFLTRDLLRQTAGADIEEVLDRYSPSPRQLEAAAYAEGVCSGLFAEFEHAFAGKAALAFDADAGGFQGRLRGVSSQRDRARGLLRLHRHWLERLPDVEARLSVVLEISDGHAAACGPLATEAALREIVEMNRVEWVVVDTDTLSFADESAAREAMLCVTADGLPLADVGTLSRQHVIRERRLVSDIPPEHRARLASAEPGQIVGPLAAGGRFGVTLVTARTLPALDNETVASRARAALLDRLARRAARTHVTRKSVNGGSSGPNTPKEYSSPDP